MLSTLQADPQADADRGAELTQAVQRYFDLMYDCDLSAFDAVFAPTVKLHGYRGDRFVVWPAVAYKEVLAQRTSPKSLGAARGEEILLMDLVGDAMAFTKVRVRIAGSEFVDYLTWHRIDSRWLITSKGFHLVAGTGPTPG